MVAALSLAVTLLIMEGAARLYARITLQQRGIGFDSELGWRLLPNVRRMGPFWGGAQPARTNSKGWRDTEHSYDKPHWVRRIVVIGDSVAFGMSVEDGERLTDGLARRLHQWEVINLGVTGYGTDQELRVLEVEGFRYAPDLVILVVSVGNDLDDIGYERLYSWPKPTYTLEGGELRLRRPQVTWDVRVRTASYLAEFLFRRIRNSASNSRHQPLWEDGHAVPLFAALVQRMATESAQRGAHFLAVLAYFRNRMEIGPTEREQRARTALEKAGIVTLDTYALFLERTRAGENLYASDERHWNARGHEVAADEIRKALRAQRWLE